MPIAPDAALRHFLNQTFCDDVRPALGVAVSGGGDSMALLHLSVDWCRARGVALQAATVDHGLRQEAADEAAFVARACAELGVAHRTLIWRGWAGQGNVQDAARRARIGLLADWAKAVGLDGVLLGHTADDQAETVLMRLARGSGVDGLAGMAAVDRSGLFLRPLLEVSRGDLRDWLRGRGIPWVEDPSNDDPRYDRVKARQMLGVLSDLGLTQARLLETAGHMRRAKVTLSAVAATWVGVHVCAQGGDLLFDRVALQLEDGDTPARVLAAAVQWIGNAPYRPRLEALREFARALQRAETRTLGGVRAQIESDGSIRLSREVAAAEGPVGIAPEPGPTIWDGRWVIERCGGDGAQNAAPLRVAALGEAGLAACPGWRDAGLPRSSLLATPAVWEGNRVIAAPLVENSPLWLASLRHPFNRFIVSH